MPGAVLSTPQRLSPALYGRRMPWRSIQVKKTWSAVVALTIVVWAVVYFTAGQIGYAIAKGTALTDFFDAYSEANGIRAGEGYADRGFRFNYGLPDVSY